MRVVRVASSKFVAAFLSSGSGERDGRVTATAPAVKFLLGMSDAKARAIIKKNKWTATITKDAGIAETCTVKLVEAPMPEPFPEHFCHCGKVGPFGTGVSLLKGIEGVWFCREHAPIFQQEKAA